MGLAVHDQRIDAAADVVDRGIAGDRDLAGVGIDLDLADGAAVGEHRLVHLVVGDDRDAVLEIVGQLVPRRLLRRARGNRRCGWCRATTKRPSLERDAVRRRAHDARAAMRLALGDQIDRGLGDHGRGMAHGAAGMRAAADLHHIGVAEDDACTRLDRHARAGRRRPARSWSRGPARSAGCRSPHRRAPSGCTVISAPARFGAPIEDST